MPNMIWITELYGAVILISVGSILATIAIAMIIFQSGNTGRLTLRHYPGCIGILASSVALILSGTVADLVFDGHQGIERVIGNLFVWSTSIFSLGIGVRTARMMAGYPEHN